MRLTLLTFIFITLSYSVPGQKLDSVVQEKISSAAKDIKGNLLTVISDTLGLKKEIDNIKKIIERPASLNKASAEYSREPIIYPFDSTGYYFADKGNVITDFTVAGIPVTLDYNYLHFSDPLSGESLNNFSFKFDKDNYLQQLKNRLQKKYDPKQLLQSLKDDVLEKAKAKAITNLQTEVAGIREKYKGSLNSLLSKVKGVKNILDADVSALTGMLLNPKFMEAVQNSEKNLSQLQQRMNLGEQIDLKVVDSFKNTLNQYKGVKEVIEKIQEHKGKWLEALLTEKFKGLQLLKSREIQQVLNDPSSIRKLAKEKLNLSGLQRLLLKAERLDLGRNALSLSPLSLQNFLSTGINAEFFNKNNYFMITAGKQPAMNSIWDNPFENNVFGGGGKVLGMSFGKGNFSSASYSHFSLFTYQNGDIQGQGTSFAPQLQRSTVVATISNKLPIGERGSLSAEISRSAMQYKNERNLLDSSPVNKTSFNNLFSTENFGKSLAYSLAYSDEYPKIGLRHEIEIKSVAHGYYNPGNSFLPSGTKEIKVDIKKSFLQRKLMLSVRADLREYKYNDADAKKWRNANYMVDARWKLKKGQYVGIRFQPLTMRRIEDHSKFNINVSQRLAAEGNIYKKISSGLSYRHYVNLAYQKNQYQAGLVGNIDNTSMMITSQQSIILRKNVVFWNTSYNNVNNKSALFYFNTSLNSDAGVSFQFLKTFSASTSAGYRFIKNWYTQAAIRQTLSGNIGKSLSMHIYVDAGKNLKVSQPLPYGPVRAEWSLKYMFKN